jgi:Fanconi anemia group M protein
MTDDVTIYVAPSERHPAMIGLADKISNLPEQYGCDIIWRAHNQWWGIQRKEIKDFIASIMDGRLAKELGQMRGHVNTPIVVIEGRLKWSSNDILMLGGYGQQITKAQYHGMLFAIMHEGVHVIFTDDTPGTVQLAKHLAAWSQKESHTSLSRRPGPEKTNMWGTVDNRDWAKHLLQGFPGIGPTVAEDIINHFGKVPLQWTVTGKQLMEVPGIGQTRAKALLQAFTPGASGPQTPPTP